MTRPALIRPANGRVIAGVAAAIADRYGWSRSAVRALMVASVLLPGPQFLAYLIGWAMIPQEAENDNALDPP